MITFTFADVAVYFLLVLLDLRNMWVVVPQHYKNHKMLPSPAFYTFALIAIALRPVTIIGMWADDWAIYQNLDWVQ